MSAVPPEPQRASATPTERTSDRTDGKAPPGPASTDFGPNEWLVDELYQRYLDDPGSVDMAWWNFFADYQPPTGSPSQQQASDAAAAPAPVPASTGPASTGPATAASGSAGAPPVDGAAPTAPAGQPASGPAGAPAAPAAAPPAAPDGGQPLAPQPAGQPAEQAASQVRLRGAAARTAA